jgi:hypothetical protein
MTSNQMAALVTTAPEELRAQLRGLSTTKLVNVAIEFCPGEAPDMVLDATRYALRELARRHQHLNDQMIRGPRG